MNDNSATASLAINFTKTDTQSPTISSFSANTSSLTWYSSSGSSNKTATFTAVVSDNVGINSISINGGTQTNVSGNTYTFTKSFSRPTLNNSINNAVTLTVQDAASNSTSNTIYITTNHVDNTPPVISSFSANNTSISLNTSNLQTQTITFTATITDNLSVNNVTLPNTTFVSSLGNTYTYSKLLKDQFHMEILVNPHIPTDSLKFLYISETITITKTDTSGPTISSFTSFLIIVTPLTTKVYVCCSC